MTFDRDHIGPDPVVWINRLLDVNESSQFSLTQIAIIGAGLMKILEELKRQRHHGELEK